MKKREAKWLQKQKDIKFVKQRKGLGNKPVSALVRLMSMIRNSRPKTDDNDL